MAGEILSSQPGHNPSGHPSRNIGRAPLFQQVDQHRVHVVGIVGDVEDGDPLAGDPNDKIKVGKLPAGKVQIALEMWTPLERPAPAELKFSINGKEAAGGTVQRTVPLTFTASETFGVGMDTCSPVADAYFYKALFAFEGTLKQLHFKNLQNERPAYQ